MKKFILAGIFCLITATFCSAQYTKLWDFNGANGSDPGGTFIISGKVLYGTTCWGGAYNEGNIFKIDTDGTGYKDLFDFNDTDGAHPTGSLTQLGGVLFGTTDYGGTNNLGVLFKIDTDGTGYKVLLDFNGANGSMTMSLSNLIISGSIIFGTPYAGGAHNAGLIFKIDTDGTGYKDIFDFGTNTGRGPRDLTLSGGILYGMTIAGGANNDGIVYKVDTDGTGYKDLLDFNGTNGNQPYAGLTLSGGVLYGTTLWGGNHADGILFKVDTDGTEFKDLYDFYGTNGGGPSGNVTLAGGILYGMVLESDQNQGTIFKIDTNGNNYVNLFVFGGINGYSPGKSLMLAGGSLFGLTNAGGLHGDGVAFKYTIGNNSTDVNHLNANNSQWSVFPNPNNGVFQLWDNSNQTGTGSIEVYNVLGELVYSTFTTHNSPFTFDLGTQPNGVYFYRIFSENGIEIGDGKVVIAH